MCRSGLYLTWVKSWCHWDKLDIGTWCWDCKLKQAVIDHCSSMRPQRMCKIHASRGKRTASVVNTLIWPGMGVVQRAKGQRWPCQRSPMTPVNWLLTHRRASSRHVIFKFSLKCRAVHLPFSEIALPGNTTVFVANYELRMLSLLEQSFVLFVFIYWLIDFFFFLHRLQFAN